MVVTGRAWRFHTWQWTTEKDFVESGFPAIHYGQIYTRYGLSADKTFTYVLPELANKLRKAQKMTYC